MTQPIVFYDINRVVEDPKALPWNFNTWKTRYVLTVTLVRRANVGPQVDLELQEAALSHHSH